MTEVGRYEVVDLRVAEAALDGNPFLHDFTADFIHESGRRVAGLPGFYDAEFGYVVRFSAPLPGRWSGTTSSAIEALHGISLDEVLCLEQLPVAGHGQFQVDRDQPQRFRWSDGTPCIPLGFEFDWLFAYHERDPQTCGRHLELLRDRGFNYLVINLYAHTGFSTPGYRPEDERPLDAAYVYGPPDTYVFGGTNDQPDHARLNLAFFRNYDQLMRLLQELGMVAHIMLQVQNKHVTWPARRSPEDNLYWRYCVARYQAFGNVVWDIGKESYNLYHETGDHGYTLGRIEAIRSLDAYHHPVTVHDPAAGSPARNCVVDRVCDFVSDQVHLGDAGAYNREALVRLADCPTPYLNIEYGYELGVDPLKTYVGGTTAEWPKVLLWTWSLYAAGAYACYYYDNVAWDLIKLEPEPPSWARYAELREVLDSIPFAHMRSRNELVDRGLCLAEPGRAYLVLLPEGGDTYLDLTAVAAPAGVRDRREYGQVRLTADWLQINSGRTARAELQVAGFRTKLANPFGDPSEPAVVIVRA